MLIILYHVLSLKSTQENAYTKSCVSLMTLHYLYNVHCNKIHQLHTLHVLSLPIVGIPQFFFPVFGNA